MKTYNNSKCRALISATLRSVLFITCFYLHDAENKMICQFIMITNELSDHSSANVNINVLMVIDHLREKQLHLLLKIKPIVWSDGCLAQFQSQSIFKLLSLKITWCYNE